MHYRVPNLRERSGWIANLRAYLGWVVRVCLGCMRFWSGVDGIPPKLLMETVEQISIPPVREFKRGWFLLNGKKQISYHYLKTVREISQRFTDQYI